MCYPMIQPPRTGLERPPWSRDIVRGGVTPAPRFLGSEKALKARQGKIESDSPESMFLVTAFARTLDVDEKQRSKSTQNVARINFS